MSRSCGLSKGKLYLQDIIYILFKDFICFFVFPSYPYVLFNLLRYVLIFLFIVMYCARSISLLSVYLFLSLKKEVSLAHAFRYSFNAWESCIELAVNRGEQRNSPINTTYNV